MAEVRSLTAFRKAQRKQKAAGKTLCRSGRHKWRLDQASQFDSKSGKLVNRYVCEHCGKVKVRAE
ncbi:hypothetical protein [Reinekea blandensis]|uniref:Uncharacterized protein n=1 Tax=Reinekea blandensis MED297 TaxID=314283 RepID=A4BI98_9GAMM|nr:hypothetical protein [Reinekea blandensis]EAR08105.1 hypothetical protein MED297_00415 [Reinekea sp. MED297] [Reinekea blandensis MED297]